MTPPVRYAISNFWFPAALSVPAGEAGNHKHQHVEERDAWGVSYALLLSTIMKEFLSYVHVMLLGTFARRKRIGAAHSRCISD